MTTSVESKLMKKFGFTAAQVVELLKAGLNTPTKIKKATKDRTLPAGISGLEKARLEVRWRK